MTQTAREEATLMARRIVDHMRPSRHELDQMALEITDCAGRLLLTVTFSDAHSQKDARQTKVVALRHPVPGRG
jgi:hypothetical protein